MRSDPSYLDLARPQLPVAGGSSHRLGNLRIALMDSRIANFRVFVTTRSSASVLWKAQQRAGAVLQQLPTRCRPSDRAAVARQQIPPVTASGSQARPGGLLDLEVDVDQVHAAPAWCCSCPTRPAPIARCGSSW